MSAEVAGGEPPAEPEWVRCEHHWVHTIQGDMPISIPQCSQCGHFNGAVIAEQIATLGAGGEPTRPSEQEWEAALANAAAYVSLSRALDELVPLIERTEAAARREVIAAVEALHRPGNRNPECCTNCGLRCPCPTVRAARSAKGETT